MSRRRRPCLLESIKGELQSREGKGIVVGKESRRRARGRQARVAGLALLARPLVVSVVGAPPVYARLLDATEDLALFFAHVRGLVPVLRREVKRLAPPLQGVGAQSARSSSAAAWEAASPKSALLSSSFTNAPRTSSTRRWRVPDRPRKRRARRRRIGGRPRVLAPYQPPRNGQKVCSARWPTSAPRDAPRRRD